MVKLVRVPGSGSAFGPGLVRGRDKEYRSLYFQNRLCVPTNNEMKKELLYEALNSVFTMYPGGNKMYQDLKQYYSCREMKGDVTKYVYKCLTCQQIKVEH